MKKSPEQQDPFPDLRRWAENRLKQERRETTDQPTSLADFQKLVHELQVHQIELEMQNEELKRARQEIEAGYRKYEDLYDFSPVGYFVWDKRGAIREANLRGAALLGQERAKLIGASFHSFVVPEFHPVIDEFIKAIFDEKGKAACEVELMKRPHPICVRIEGMIGEPNQDTGECCRLGVMDVTGSKQAERQLRQCELREKKMEEEIRLLALTDALTGLYNRRGFIAFAEQHLKTANRTGRKLMLLFVDIDDMKYISDTWGHEEGDRALVAATGILKQTFRESDIVARIGGDEFAVLAIDAVNPPEAVLKRLADRTGSYTAANAQPYALSMSIGTAIYDVAAPCSVDELMSRADEAMYEQKRRKAAVGRR